MIENPTGSRSNLPTQDAAETEWEAYLQGEYNHSVEIAEPGKVGEYNTGTGSQTGSWDPFMAGAV